MTASIPTPPAGQRVPIGSAELVLRPAVACRERHFAHGSCLYLSVYEEEIDARAEALWSAWQPDVGAPRWLPLELTDAVIWSGPRHELRVARGGSATFPLYWSAQGGRLRFATALPLLEGGPLSRAGLVSAAAAACLHGSYEPNGFVATPLAHWRRVRRAALLRFRDSRLLEERPFPPPPEEPRADPSAVATQVRAALDSYGRSQHSIHASLLELSGGFDSTLAAAGPSRQGMRGVSVVFPYYEFRFEAPVQRATAEFLGIPRVELDGLGLFPYAPGDAPARFDEPTVFVTGIRHAEAVARLGGTFGAKRLYVGHGGDQCFATDLCAPEPLAANALTRGPFAVRAWREVRRAIDETHRSPWNDRRLGTFVFDARQVVWGKETFGSSMRTPFSDLQVFRSALTWSRACASRGVRPHKGILAQAARDLLPDAVLERKGKVAYDGVWTRAYRRHGESIAATFEDVRDVFSHLGVSTDWLQRRVLELGAWQDRSDREVLALFGIAVWLTAWGLLRAGDLHWAD